MKNRTCNKKSGRLISLLLVLTLLLSVSSLSSYAILGDSSKTKDNTTALAYDTAVLNYINTVGADALSFVDTARVVDPVLAAKAKELTASASTDLEKAQAIHDWVSYNICYDNDFINGKGEGVADARAAYDQHRGTCRQYADLVADFCNTVGIPCIVVDGSLASYSSDTSRTVAGLLAAKIGDHSWNLAYIGGKWIIIDCTWDSASTYENGTHTYKTAYNYYFNCDVSLIACSRTFAVNWYFNYQGYGVHLAEDGVDTICEIYNYTGSDKDLRVPSSVNGVPVTAVNISLNKTNKTVRSIYVSDGVKELTISGQQALESLYIPASVTSAKTVFSNAYLTDIYYAGTADQWNAVSFDDLAAKGSQVEIHYSAADIHIHDFVLQGAVCPSCTDGTETYHCDGCGRTITRTIKGTGHVDANNDGVCDICGKTIPTASKSFIQKIIEFFNRIIAFFRSLFGGKS